MKEEQNKVMYFAHDYYLSKSAKKEMYQISTNYYTFLISFANAYATRKKYCIPKYDVKEYFIFSSVVL